MALLYSEIFAPKKEPLKILQIGLYYVGRSCHENAPFAFNWALNSHAAWFALKAVTRHAMVFK